MIKANAMTTNLVLVGALGVAAYFVVRQAGGKVEETFRDVGEAINPANNDNVISNAVNRAGEAVTGKKGFSLGSWLYDVFHDEYDPNAVAKDAAFDVPENPDNARNRVDPNTYILPSFREAWQRQLVNAGLDI